MVGTAAPTRPGKPGEELAAPQRLEARGATHEPFTPAAVRLVAAVGSVATIATALLVFSRSRHYLELADQSLYLLMIDEPRAAIRSASGYHVLLAPLFHMVGESIIGFRVLRAVLDIGVDIALGLSLVRYLRWRSASAVFESTAGAITVVSSVTLAGFSVWIYAVNGFGYDQLGGILFTAWAAAVLWLVASESSSKQATMLTFSIGFIFTLGAIVRWTAALAVAGLFVWIVAERFGRRRVPSLLASTLVGAVSSAMAVHLFIFDVPTLVQGILSGTSDVSRDTHSLPVLLDEYVVSVASGFGGSIGVLIAGVGTFFILRNASEVRYVLLAALVGSGVVLFGVHTLFGLPHHIEANAIGAVLAVAGVAVWVSYARSVFASGELGRPRNLGLTATLVSLPVLLAAGTFLPLFLTSLPLAPLWIVSLWILVPEVAAPRLRVGAAIIGLVIVSAMPLLTWQGLHTPARTLATDSPVEVQRGRLAGLWVDKTSQQMLHDLEDLRVRLEPNPTVISLWVRPVVPFALEGTGLGFPWYNPNAPNAAAETLSRACLDDGDVPTGDVVIVTEETDPAAFGPIRDGLRDCGIDFPNGFEYVATTVAPIDVDLYIYVRPGVG